MSKESKERILQSWQILDDTFEVDIRYNVTDFLGAGAYGIVCAVHDNITDEFVAMKKCRKVFHSRTLAKRTIREVRILRLLQHSNIISVKSILKPPNFFAFNEIYVLFELMETDLSQIIRSNQYLTDEHLQFFIYQILSALIYLHAKHVIHRDLK